MRLKRVMCALLVLIAVPAVAQEAAPAPGATDAGVASSGLIRDEAPVVVTGMLPGPGLWKVSKGDHVLYVLGTVSPLPKGMQWVSRDIEDVLAQAGEVLLGRGVHVTADVGFFGKLALVPSLLGARKNPDGATLRALVPADDYARWLRLKQRYIGRDNGIEQWRPVFAATQLYEAAIEDGGLVTSGIVHPIIERGIKQRPIKRTEPRVKIALKEPKAALKEFRAERLSDLDCFHKTLVNLETDLARMTERANAWAVGDIDTLRALPLGDQYQACAQAMTQGVAARKHGLGGLEAESERVWLAAAEQAIANNAVSLATLPMSEVIDPDGYLAKLQGLGYVVEAP